MGHSKFPTAILVAGTSMNSADKVAKAVSMAERFYEAVASAEFPSTEREQGVEAEANAVVQATGKERMGVVVVSKGLSSVVEKVDAIEPVVPLEPHSHDEASMWMSKGKEHANMVSSSSCSSGDKEDEEGGWKLVQGRSRNSKSSRCATKRLKGESGGIFSRNVVCFRCLGRGHLANACRDPPRCWTCKKLGHRSFVCRSALRGGPSLGGSTRPPGGTSFTPPPRVEVEWSPEILDRARALGKSVVAF
ncbi:hypothetical protein QJS10_CPB15g00907 [Acorus calamus]|uniref:CCHC-type domain-containing protein n=1 Tax=Acorus calamus TaxID=4465 RepID=A0AAV9D8I3_ACOCL|nr:hypothetical protein QJS10_CPB15g00907 [Acorus calamus]